MIWGIMNKTEDQEFTLNKVLRIIIHKCCAGGVGAMKGISTWLFLRLNTLPVGIAARVKECILTGEVTVGLFKIGCRLRNSSSSDNFS
jgi:hypothetical protein